MINDSQLNSYDSQWRRKLKTLFGSVDVNININDAQRESFSSENKRQIIN